MSEIAIVNQVPNLLTTDDVNRMAKALSFHLSMHFCPEWGIRAPVVSVYPDRASVPETAWEVLLIDSPSNADGTEAFHDDSSGKPDGFVYCGYLLAHGGQKFTGEGCVSVAFGHEVDEMLRDPRCNLVIKTPIVGPDGKQYVSVWAEVCDPVQGGHLSYEVDGFEVWMPAFVTQSWEDPMGQPPYSAPAGAVGAPLSCGEGGYLGLEDAAGHVNQVFAARPPPEHIVQLKLLHGRRGR